MLAVRLCLLVRLNALLFVPFLTGFVGGFDGSMLNGVQTLKHWQEGSYQHMYWRKLEGSWCAFRIQYTLKLTRD